MKYPFLIVALIIFFFPSKVFSFPDIPGSIAVTQWKVLYAQDSSLEKARESGGWLPVRMPLKLRLPYKPERSFQYCWLRGEFIIEDNPERYYGVTFGRIKYTYTIYINNSG